MGNKVCCICKGPTGVWSCGTLDRAALCLKPECKRKRKTQLQKERRAADRRVEARQPAARPQRHEGEQFKLPAVADKPVARRNVKVARKKSRRIVAVTRRKKTRKASR